MPAVRWFMGIIVLITVLAMIGMWWASTRLEQDLADSDVPTPTALAGEERPVPPEPHLQTSPYRDWSELLASYEEHLSTYDWVDRAQGIVRTPVSVAMERIAAEGLPRFPRVSPQAPSAKGDE